MSTKKDDIVKKKKKSGTSSFPKQEIVQFLQRNLAWVLTMVVVLGLWGFASSKQNTKRCKSVIIHLNEQDGQFFIDKKDVYSIVSLNGTEHIEGSPFKRLNLKLLEERLNKNSFVKNAEVYTDLSGHLFVDVEQKQPIARILKSNGKGFYIDADGKNFPLSDNYTARVLTLDGAYTKNFKLEKDLIDQKKHFPYIKLIDAIYKNRFLKGMIAHIEIDKKGETTFYPQLENVYFRFGKAERIEDKLDKVFLFYKKILPEVGMGKYKVVDLRYKDQIVCK